MARRESYSDWQVTVMPNTFLVWLIEWSGLTRPTYLLKIFPSSFYKSCYRDILLLNVKTFDSFDSFFLYHVSFGTKVLETKLLTLNDILQWPPSDVRWWHFSICIMTNSMSQLSKWLHWTWGKSSTFFSLWLILNARSKFSIFCN